MRLRITTPLAVVIEEEGVLALRAEDATGGFGILPGHADFLTSLSISVARWTGADGMRHIVQYAAASSPSLPGER